MTIDGNPSDWNGKGRILEDENMMFAVANDDEFLYLAMFVSEQDKLAQVFAQGMTVWFDPGGGKKKRFGVRFPLGKEGGDSDSSSGGGTARGRGSRAGGVELPPDPNSGRASTRPPQTPADRVAAMRELEIVGPDMDEGQRAPLDDVRDVSLRASWQGQGLFYELSIPLARSEKTPYGIAVRSDKPLGIGIETPRVQRAPSIRGMTGSTGVRGTSSGIPQSAGQMASRLPPKQLRVWVKVELAESPTNR